MIFEYSILLSLFSLTAVLFFSALTMRSNQEYSIMRESNLTETETFKRIGKKLNLNFRILAFFLWMLLSARILIFLTAGGSFLAFSSQPDALTDYLFISFVYLVFWSVLIYFILLRPEIKPAEQTRFNRKALQISLLLFVSDFITSVLLTQVVFKNYFNITFTDMAQPLQASLSSFDNAFWFPVILLLVLSGLLIAFELKRSLRMIRLYWAFTVLLMVAWGLQWLTQTGAVLGWFHATEAGLALLSFKYGFVLWLSLLVAASVVFFNLSAIILLILKDSLVKPQKFRSQILLFVRIGYIAAIAFTTILNLPQLLLLFY